MNPEIRPNQDSRISAQGMVRIGPLMNLPALVRDLGCDPNPIFVDMGFNPDQFTDPDTEISFISGSSLLARCVVETGCDQLGLRLGMRTTPSSLGVVGFMLPAAPTVGDALHDLVSHLDLHDGGAAVKLDTEGDNTILSYAIYLSGVSAADQINDIAMVISCKIMRTLCGAYWKPNEVLLPRRRPQEFAHYRRFFRAPVRFNVDRCALVFPTIWLDHSITTSDPLLHAHLKKEAQALRAASKADFVAYIRRLLRHSLATQESTATAIAKRLGIHERTLNRRLREADTTFRREFEEVRYDIARQLLTDTNIPMAQIASSLNYADATAFSRAFKRWSGEAPAEWRRHHRRT